MTAVTKCYPGPSGNGKGDRVPSRAEQSLCRPWLATELRLVNPRLIILVGGLAIKLLYPVAARLEEIVGTAAYFPPAVTGPLLEAGLDQARVLTSAAQIHPAAIGGRFVVPLPHPSGASLWPNKPENQTLIRRAIALLGMVREANDL
jgi:uracil-DNA glycosylase